MRTISQVAKSLDISHSFGGVSSNQQCMCFMYTSHSCGVKWKTYNFKEVKGVKTTKNCKTTNFARFFWWLSKGIELAPHPTVKPNEHIFKRKLHSRWCYWECWKEQNDKKKFFFLKVEQVQLELERIYSFYNTINSIIERLTLCVVDFVRWTIPEKNFTYYIPVDI